VSDARPRVGFVGPSLALGVVRAALGDRLQTVPIAIDASVLRAELPTLDGLVDATTRLPLDAAAFAAASRLQIVSVAGTGDAHVDRDAAVARGIAVRTLAEDRELLETFNPTAEHTWGLLLASARRITEASSHVLSGGWERERFPGALLAGRCLGIVGLGRLGRKVARFGTAFGMQVIAHDQTIHPEVPEGIQMVDLERLFATADFVSIHLPLDSSTRGIVDQRLLGLMRPTSILINTSRGAVIDEAALAAAIREHTIAGAALDVLANEPPASDDPLVALARADGRLLITPHLGGYVPDVLCRACEHAAAKVRTYLAGAI
jgi:D-3-phosphoglycerate dehydrogenase / 2-oxoglutarate reductase